MMEEFLMYLCKHSCKLQENNVEVWRLRRTRLFNPFRILCILGVLLWCVNICSYSQEPNILNDNRALLKNISKFSAITPVNENYIRFLSEDVRRKANYGFGVAFRETGQIIHDADPKTSYFITANGEYIILAKESDCYFKHGNDDDYVIQGGDTLMQNKFGIINNKGEVVLDFQYDRIGSVHVPLPDTMITVQMANKFGIFNTKTATLSEIKYDNNGNLNDGYRYHEGGAYSMDQAIYSQLGIEEVPRKEVPYIECLFDLKAIKEGNKTYGDTAYLVNKAGERKSEMYYSIKTLARYMSRLCDDKSCTACNPYFVAGILIKGEKHWLDTLKYVLLDEEGKIVYELPKDFLGNYNEHYIQLHGYIKKSDTLSKYFFIDTKKTVSIPKYYVLYVSCYSHKGFLGFRNLETGEKLFVDKYGNMIKEAEL